MAQGKGTEGGEMITVSESLIFHGPMFDALPAKQPHRCPVCYGTGQVDHNFYNQTSGQWSTTDNASETCHTCDGAGIIWEMKAKNEST